MANTFFFIFIFYIKNVMNISLHLTWQQNNLYLWQSNNWDRAKI
jgi:hypothetical protein